ncbi:Phosphopantothenate-cysteine ligase/Phosphopantothenoylcysteine decarboxylase [Geoglobus ahangari]|uniref:Coenzyme A biosynthesis bifunctional protein CoaBC n=1 Tax=Geoglobus ahangari TaxID=113653 RepID=A0A0F7IG09_9EURY|nr:bifunctional phosphopantothenoylcysteine decarboxylase/phosphopantothenate--cysteine ligase CoaBC [Geoglobus ahangari]AKG92115.1 Phosphopantothenate-cysteine ligase/Phosphopantothenoylcysteine decarboxylase [Geoglobus ahangari]
MHLTRIRGSRSLKLSGKKIVLGVTGSIAAIEAVKLARELVRRGAEVHAVMSEAAQKIIHPYALEFATDNRVVTEITGMIEHVEFLGVDGSADLLLIAPATANTIAKIAAGIDDTPVTTMATTALGSGKSIIIAPAMHESMINNPAVVKAIEKLKRAGVEFVEPRYEEGKAKFPEIEKICLQVERRLYERDLEGRKVVVTAGPTMEFLDPIRYITNRSSGKMGYEIALEFWRRGARVTLITSKPPAFDLPDFEVVRVISVKDMLDASLNAVRDADVFVSSAAAADFTMDMKNSKIKTAEKLTLELVAAPKVLREVRKVFDGKVIAFKAETGVSDEELERIAREKMQTDRAEMIVANDVLNIGMGTEDTRVLIITSQRKLWIEGGKQEVAERIVDYFVRDCL